MGLRARATNQTLILLAVIFHSGADFRALQTVNRSTTQFDPPYVQSEQKIRDAALEISSDEQQYKEVPKWFGSVQSQEIRGPHVLPQSFALCGRPLRPLNLM